MLGSGFLSLLKKKKEKVLLRLYMTKELKKGKGVGRLTIWKASFN